MAVLESEMAFRRGEMALRRNDFTGAIRELEAAVSGNPQEGEHLALLCWARVSAGQMTWADAKPRLSEAVKLSPRCARAHYYLGLAHKDEGAADRALSAFKKAHDLDQRLIDAEREIRLIHMRREKEKNPKGGLFDRFRKK
jgi:tetratricopeptide (TPR) repeat protein